MAPPQFEAVNLISDPIHGYIELTKRLTPEQSGRAGLAPEAVAEAGLPGPPGVAALRRPRPRPPPRPLRRFGGRPRPGALPRAATSQPRPGEAPQPRGSRP